MRSRADPPQPGNPHQLARKQHVFPKASIDRFVGVDGCVDVADFRRDKRRSARSTDPLFCADRAWDHASEVGFMKRTEDRFQALTVVILQNTAVAFDPAENQIISRFYALWHARAERRHLAIQYIKPNGVVPGNAGRTDDELELLEKNGYMAARDDGSIAFRHLNAVHISIRMGRLEREIMAGRGWGVITAQAGEFCVPGSPVHGIIPIAPTVALVQNCMTGRITESNLGEINSAMISKADDYAFARALDACPGVGRLPG